MADLTRREYNRGILDGDLFINNETKHIIRVAENSPYHDYVSVYDVTYYIDRGGGKCGELCKEPLMGFHVRFSPYLLVDENLTREAAAERAFKPIIEASAENTRREMQNAKA